VRQTRIGPGLSDRSQSGEDRNPSVDEFSPTRPGYLSSFIGVHLRLGFLELLHVLRRELRRFELNRYLVDLAGELERDLIVLVVHRCKGGIPDVDHGVQRFGQGQSVFHFLGRHDLAVHLQRSGAAAADATHVIICQRLCTEAVVPEVELEGVLSGRERRALPLRPLEAQEIIGEDRFAFQQVQAVTEEPPPSTPPTNLLNQFCQSNPKHVFYHKMRSAEGYGNGCSVDFR
jgi:hypothetical protein